MEQWISGIWEYLQSPEFQAILTSILAIYAIVRPIINKFVSLSSNKKLELAKTKLANAKEEVEAIKAQIDEYKAVAVQVQSVATTLASNASKQNNALKYAFDRSNLKEDVKGKIAELLPDVDGFIETAKEVVADKVEEVKAVVEPVAEQVSEVVEEVSESPLLIRKFD